MAPPAPGPAPQLQSIEVRDGELTVLDRQSRQEWRLHGVEAVLRRLEEGLALRLAGELEAGDAVVPVRAEGLYGLGGAVDAEAPARPVRGERKMTNIARKPEGPIISATAKARGNDGLRYAWPEVRRQPMASALQRV